MSATTNPTAALINAGISEVDRIGLAAAEAILFADIPWLGLPGVKQFIEAILGWLSTYWVRGMQTVSTFKVIDFQIGQEKNDFGKALFDLKSAQATGDANAIASALKKFQQAAVHLGNSDGSAPVS